MSVTFDIDPTNLKDSAEQQLIGTLFTQYEEHQLFLSGFSYPIGEGKRINLKTPVYKRERANKRNEEGYRFEPIAAKIGEGDFGSVYSNAKTLNLDASSSSVTANPKKNRVTKVIKSRAGESAQDFENRVAREYELANLSGKLNVKRPVFFALQTEGANGKITESYEAYMTMKSVGECSLNNYLDKHGKLLTNEQRRDLSIAILKAIQELIDKGIIHRDLKPDNLRVSDVDGKYTVTVVDFGLAKLASDTTEPSKVHYGSSIHSAPETRDPTLYSHASDIFSGGKILLEVWGGSHPDLPKHIEETKNISLKAQLMLAFDYQQNSTHPLYKLFNKVRDLDPSNQEVIRHQLEQLTHLDVAKRGETLHEYIKQFKKLDFTPKTVSVVDVGMKEDAQPINLPTTPSFFSQAAASQILTALAQKDRKSLRTHLAAVDFDNWFTPDNQINRIISAVLSYLKNALKSKKSFASSFFANIELPVSDKRLQQAYDILVDVKEGKTEVAEKTLASIKSSLVLEKRMKNALQYALKAPVTQGCHFQAAITAGNDCRIVPPLTAGFETKYQTARV